MSTEKLLKIKQQIESAKSKSATIKGQIQSETEQLKTKFEITELQDAKNLLKDIGGKIDKKESEFKDKFEKLENSYNWE